MKFRVVFCAMLACNTMYAARSGEVIGRDLNYPHLGWIGHLGMATGDDVFLPTNILIEAMAGKGIQFNNVDKFAQASKYWGSKFGLITNSAIMYSALVEAKHQSFWCPSYNPTVVYRVGKGFFNGFNQPVPTVCALWRCDTFVDYIFYYGGYPNLLRFASLPLTTFSVFPYYHDQPAKKLMTEHVISDDDDDRFLSLTAKELNNLSMEDKFKFIDIRPENITVAHAAKEWEFIKNPEVYTILRQMMIDIRSASVDPDLIKKFINIYDAEDNEEIKDSLLTGIMRFYQSNWEQVKSSGDYETLRTFYARVLNESPKKYLSPIIVRSYVDTHDDSEIKSQIQLIDEHMKIMEPKPRLGLQLEIIRKSPSLEHKYFNKMISGLKKEQTPELDDMFMYLMGQGFVNYVTESDKTVLKSYIQSIKMKNQDIKSLSDDPIDSYFRKETAVDMKALEDKL